MVKKKVPSKTFCKVHHGPRYDVPGTTLLSMPHKVSLAYLGIGYRGHLFWHFLVQEKVQWVRNRREYFVFKTQSCGKDKLPVTSGMMTWATAISVSASRDYSDGVSYSRYGRGFGTPVNRSRTEELNHSYTWSQTRFLAKSTGGSKLSPTR